MLFSFFQRRIFSFLLILPLAGAPFLRAQSDALHQADSAYRAGLAAISRGDLHAAQQSFATVVRLDPAAEQGHSALGAVLVRLGQYPEGIHELTLALRLNPSDHSAQENLALAYQQSGANARAIPLFQADLAAARAAHRTLPVGVIESYARSLASLGRIAEAASIFAQAAHAHPSNASLQDELGTLYALGHNWQAAESAFRAAIATQPDNALAHLHLGSVLAAMQRPGASAEWLASARLAPQNGAIQLQAGSALARAGSDAAALPLLQRAHALLPQSAQATLQLALVLQRQSQIAAAIPLFQRVLAQSPNDPDTLVNLGMAYTQQQQAKLGIPYLRRAITLDPRNTMAHQDLAAAFIQLNQVEDAVTEMKAALALDPNSPQLHYNLGLAYKMQDNATDAMPQLLAAEKLNPDAWEPAYVLGLLDLQEGRYADAEPQLEHAMKVHPENGEGWSMLGSVYSKLGKLPQAQAALEHAIQQMPAQSDAHLLLANVYMAEKKPDLAIAQRKLAASLMRNHMNEQRAEVATHSGQSLLAAGKLDAAAVEFHNAIGFDSSYADAHRGLAAVYQRQGKMTEAAIENSLAAKVQPATH
jgi:tetratricopeptide (TPR) repeat protein